MTLANKQDSTKRNIIYQSIYHILTLILPFVTAPYIARVLGADQVGIYSYTYSTVYYFMMFALLGIDFYGNRMVARVREDQNALNKVFSGIFYSHLIPSAIAVAAYLVFCAFMPPVYRLICLIQLLYVLSEAMNINWLFAGLGKFKVTVTRNIVIKIITIAAIFLFVRTADDLLLYIIIMAVGSFVSQSAVWVVFYKYVRFVKVPVREVLSHIKPTAVLFISVIATNIYRMIGKTMLGSQDALGALGCFEYADKIVRMPLSLIIAIGSVMLSKTSNMLAKGDNDKAIQMMISTLRYITVFSSLIIFGLMAVSTDFSVLFFGAEYEYTGAILNVMACSLLFMAWTTVLRSQYFMPANKDRHYVISVWAGAVINVGLNLVLIPRYDAIGAAIASDISYFFVLATQLFFARKDVRVWELVKGSIAPFASGIVMYISIRLLRSVLSCNWVSLGVQIVLGTSVFGLLMLLYWLKTKDPVVIRFLRKVGLGSK